jgi:sec-independent protein translocase protein TatA
MPGFIGLPELLILGLVVLLVFGPKRLPEMGRSMGRGLREFKSSITGEDKNQEPLDFGELEPVEAPVQLPPERRQAVGS